MRKREWILCALAAMIPAQGIFATDFTGTVTAPPNKTLNPGDTVTTTRGNGVVAASGGILNASGVTITTTGTNGFGAVATGGQLSILNSTVITHGSGAAGLALLPNPPNGSTLTVTGSTVSNTGADAPGILFRSQTSRGEFNVITLDSTKVTTQLGNGIQAEAPGT
jgi:hypothetical protein